MRFGRRASLSSNLSSSSTATSSSSSSLNPFSRHLRRGVERTSSCTSTVSVDFLSSSCGCSSTTHEPLTTLPRTTRSTTISSTKRVQFDETADNPLVISSQPSVVDNDNNTAQEDNLSSLWYSKTELKRFQQANALIVKGLVRTKQDFVKTLQHVYQHDCPAAAFAGSKRDCASMVVSVHSSSALIKVTCPEYIGLEELCLCLSMSDNSTMRRRQRLWRLVVTQKNPEKLQRACEKLSRPSQRWARYLAEAQFLTV